MTKDTDDQMLKSMKMQSERRHRYESRRSFWTQTVYTGTLGVIFVLPVVTGAYLGLWLDTKLSGYSISWTINLILLGVIVGAINVYKFVKDHS